MLLWNWTTDIFSNQCFNFRGLYISRSRTPQSYVSSSFRLVFFFFLEETTILFSTVTTIIYIPTNSAQRFLFFHILTNICHFVSFFFFDGSYSNKCVEISHCGFNLHFSDAKALHFVVYLIEIFNSYIGSILFY